MHIVENLLKVICLKIRFFFQPKGSKFDLFKIYSLKYLKNVWKE